MRKRTLSDPESGGIFILVALMLLVLLMIAAVSMSKNSFRQVVIAGTARQASSVINTADTGLEWSLFWMYPPNRTAGAPGAGATAVINALNTLNDPTLAGKPQLIAATGEMVTLPDPINGSIRSYDIQVTQMGRVKPYGFSVQNVEFYPLAWAVRSDAKLKYPGLAGLTFQHSREMWLTTPISNITNQ